MEKGIKLDLLSFSISLVLHALIFSVPFFSEAFFVKTYKIVDVLPISFDTVVDSPLVGIRSVKGSKESSSSSAATFLPSGRTSRKLKKTEKAGREALKTGKFRSCRREGRRASSSTEKALSIRRGNGQLTLSWSISVPDGKNGRKLPAVSTRKIVPYLLKVRDRIMSNWKNPYIGKALLQEDRKVVIYVTINRNGKLDEINVEHFSPDMAFNRSAISAIYSSEPFDPIPPSIKLDKVRIKVNFEVK